MLLHKQLLFHLARRLLSGKAPHMYVLNALFSKGDKAAWQAVPGSALPACGLTQAPGPRAQGFVSNRDSAGGAERGDPVETVLYAVFVATSARASVAELADMLQVGLRG